MLTLLAAGCAVNPLTPTPAATAPEVAVALRVGTGSAPLSTTAEAGVAASATEAGAREVPPTLPPTDEPTAEPMATVGALVISTEVSIVELTLTPTLPPAPLPTSAPPLPDVAQPPAPTAVPPIVVAPPVSADVAAAEQYCIDLINAQRAAAGLPAYARDETVMGIARARVADMVARGYRGHNDPVTGASLARQMLLGAGFRLAGENWYGHRAGPVAIVEAAMAWFMTDPPHAQGILSGSYTLVGVGIAYNGTQWLLIQNFAGY